MKINTNVTRKYQNDCWCTSISKSTGLNYDRVYKDFKHFLQDNKGADLQTIRAYLNNKGYHSISVELDLKTSLQIYNTNEEAHTIFSLEDSSDSNLGHMVFVKDKVIYDDLNEIDYNNYIDNWNVDMVFIKEKL